MSSIHSPGQCHLLCCSSSNVTILESRVEPKARGDGSSELPFSSSSDSISLRRALSLSISLQAFYQYCVAGHADLAHLTHRFAEDSVRASFERLLLHRLPLLWQFLHGSWSSHFMRLRRHQSHARATWFRLGFTVAFIVEGSSLMPCKSNELLSVVNMVELSAKAGEVQEIIFWHTGIVTG